MSLLNSVGKELKPVLRFGGWQTIGAQTRPADTRTTAQLLENIEYFAQKNSAIAKFKDELKSVNPKHLGLVSDICELGSHNELMSQGIDMNTLKSNDGKSLLAYILEKLPKASKENPQAMEFTKEVIDHADTTASKYFLADFGGILGYPQAAKHLEATKPLVKDIAEETLNGYKMDFENERKFLTTNVNYAKAPQKLDIEAIKAGDVKLG